MRVAGVETTVNSDELAIMGIVEVGRVFPNSSKPSENYETRRFEITRCGDPC